MAILIEPPSQPTTFSNISQKPVWLSDDIIDWDEIQNKPSSFTPSTHTHALSSLSGVSIANPLTNQLLKFNGTNWVNGVANWNEVQNKPSSFPPITHTHDYLPLNGGALTGSISMAANSGSVISDTLSTFGDASINPRLVNSCYGNTAIAGSVLGIAPQGWVTSVASGGRGWALGTASATPLIFSTASVERLRITELGRFVFAGLPSSNAGLVAGMAWRDSNGFLRIV